MQTILEVILLMLTGSMLLLVIGINVLLWTVVHTIFRELKSNNN